VEIKYEKPDGVAYITLNKPEKANILDKATSDEIAAVTRGRRTERGAWTENLSR
jgi:enoyl-CoA hydratase/carnithine racemase